ncbi:MAG: FAD-binding oxidoreductase [Chloroflexi bacterium]|nr:FAD-binding oxidoreductase [Chloroflexota bacterium]
MSKDVVIIGGGIVGCACAHYLIQAGMSVHLVERGPLGSGASKSGMMHVVTWEEPEIHLELGRASRRLYEELSQELPADIEFRPTGSTAVVEKPEGMASLEAMVGRLQGWGLKCRLLSSQDLAEMEPNLASDLACGAHFEEDAMVNPLVVTLALAQAARERGAVIETGSEVIGFERVSGKGTIAAVLTSRGRIPTGCAVIAAGAWSAAVGKLAGIDIPITPRKGTLVVTTPVPEDLIHCKIVLAAGYMDTVKDGAASGVAVAANIEQSRNGNLLLGSSRQFVGFDTAVDTQVVAKILRRCLRFLPALAQVTAIRTWVGFRPYTPDLLPIISPVEAVEGLFIAAGHEGLGITEGPVTGKLVSQMLTGQKPEIDLTQLSFSRFTQ